MSKGGARILVVDDEIEIMRALQRSLTAHGQRRGGNRGDYSSPA